MRRIARFALAAAALTVLTAPASAMSPQDAGNPFSFLSAIFGGQQQQAAPQPASYSSYAADPQADYATSRSTRDTVVYTGGQAPGTIIISTSERRLYLVLPGNRAIRYAVGVGREGFQWAGKQAITRKAEWPDWRPPADMLKRRPDLPRYMAGGIDNPLGARAMYLGNSIYRIHGSNEPDTIGQAVSSGCIRMLNQDVVDLYNRVKVGTQVVVLR